MSIICGVDEAGRGPVIGPMVIAIVCVDKSQVDFLLKLGVKDSKELRPDRRAKIALEIMRCARYVKYIIVPPDEIDRYVARNRLNLLEAEKTTELIRQALSELGEIDVVYVDSPDVKPDRYAQTLRQMLDIDVRIEASHKADRQIPVVSAASIVAKYIRDSEIEKLRQIYGDFGSGYPSDLKTIKFILSYVKQHHELPPIVRKTWSTARRLYREALRAKLFKD